MKSFDEVKESDLLISSAKTLKFYKRVTAVLLLLLVAISLSFIVVVVVVKSGNPSCGRESLQRKKAAPCVSPYKQDTGLPKDPTVFQDLSRDEYHAVRDYMLKKSGLGIVPHDEAKENSNYIYLIELYIPKKEDVLAYLDGNGPKPIRKARVIVTNGAKSTPDVEEYLVEPLPKPTTHTQLKMAGYVHPIPFATRPYTGREDNEVFKMLQNVTRDCYTILKESFGFWYHNCTTECLVPIFDGIAVSASNMKRQTWAGFHRNIPGFNLMPVPFLVLLDHTDRDISKWQILKVFYNDQLFDSVKELIEKYNNNTIKKIRYPLDPVSQKTGTFERRGESFLKKPMRGPTIANTQGHRFSVEGRKISYMGWQFHIGMRSSAGPALYDVRFNNSRIIYELSMQEAASLYSAHNPRQSMAQFLDSFFKFGSSDYELLKGIDCPENAVFVDSFHFVDVGETNKHPNSVCIFEMDNGIALRRHVEFDLADGRFSFVAGMADHVLVVRSTLVPLNYDYIADFIFYQTGMVEVRLSASGYVYATNYYSPESKYAFESLHHVTGTIHDHMILYKADLDVAGQQNSYQTLDVAVKNVSCPWTTLGYVMKKTIERNTKLTEQDALLKYDFEMPKYLLFHNENSKNRFNNTRGYRIQIDDMVKQKYPDDYYVTRAAPWSKYQMVVTKQKDTERYGSSVLNQYGMGSPSFDFDAYIKDNDNIVNEDLVAWITIGGLHMPNTEDMPVTPTSGNRFSFFIRPFGYFDEDPSMSSTDAVLISQDKTGKKSIETYGTPKTSTCSIPDRDFNYQTT